MIKGLPFIVLNVPIHRILMITFLRTIVINRFQLFIGVQNVDFCGKSGTGETCLAPGA
jgi:hypothetical protein